MSWREQYRLAGKLPGFARKEQRALSLLKDVMSRGKSAVCCSFGKDSIVITHLCLRLDPATPVLFSDRSTKGGGELPETYELIETWKQRYNISLHIGRPDRTLFDIMDQFDDPFGVDEPRALSQIRKHITAAPLERLQTKLGVKVVIMGLRAEENPNTRGKLAKFRGSVYYSRPRDCWVCNPIIYWSAKDVWAYIVKHDLPYHPIYDQENFRTREDIRISNWAGVPGRTVGRFVELKYHYPDLWQALIERYPEAGKYV